MRPLRSLHENRACATLDTAVARTSYYDGPWSLYLVTDSGACDRTYDFQVQITNAIVSHPNLLKFKGRVLSSGLVRVCVTAGAKYASGSGRLSQASGSGRWSGRSGGDRCFGHWTAQRF